MKVKIIDGKIARAELSDTETYTLIVNGEEHNWVIDGTPENYNYEIVGDKCVIDTDNPKEA